MTNVKPQTTIKVAIIGGGPAGLGAAIALSRLPFVDWKLYEKKPEISEIGNGLTLQPITWRVLEHFGASHHIKSDDIFRPIDGHNTEHRNGLSGVLEAKAAPKEGVPPHQESCRAHRSVLQQALLKEVDQSRIRVGQKLEKVEKLSSGKLRITFAGVFSDEVDLLVGADGIRSVVRQFFFPEHRIAYTGSTAYRTLVRTDEAEKINGLPKAVIFWHGTNKKWVYTCPLGGNDWEVTCAVAEPGGENRSSWGKQASVKHFTDTFSEMCQPIQELFKLVTYVEQYDYFAGPRLDSVTRDGVAVLIGDASHPLSGAFGAGAGFALEDAYVLGQALQWSNDTHRELKHALQLFDQVRSPHYNALYKVLDEFGETEKYLAQAGLNQEEEIAERIKRNWGHNANWMHYYEVDKAFRQVLSKVESQTTKL
ncbi:unnamed protein product [Clonostachys byssicola]|uniref:FAD-binding domain-containing protein n=1 Tax=Clonostachys byssicola TaxID=160290 RepID=A0A9N9UKC4_9HYPO|nr:unnamed protein product [Clonostachys byssicola]